MSKDIAVEHKPHSEVTKIFKTIYCMPKRFLSHNRASEYPYGACRLFYGGLCDINKLTDACSTLNCLPSSFWLFQFVDMG